MGFFSNKKTSWHSATIPMLDGEPDDLIRNSVMASVLLDRPIVEDLLVNSMSGFGARALYFYNYANENAPEFLLKSKVLNKTPSATVAKDVLVKQILPKVNNQHQRVKVTAVSLGEPEPEDFAFKYLADNGCGMDYSTYKLTTAPPNFPHDTAAKDIYFSYAELVADNQVRIYYIAAELGAPVALGEDFLVTGSGGDVITRDEVSDFYLPDASPYQPGEYQFSTTKYYVLNGKQEITGELQYWIYAHDSDVYPIMDNAIQKVTTSNYFPIIPLLEDGVERWTDGFRNSPIQAEKDRWRHSNNMAKLLQFNYQDVGEAQKGTDEEPNPDYDQLDYSFVSLSIPIQTEEETSIKYLYDYFQYLKDISTTTKANFDHDIEQGVEPAYSELILENGFGYKTKLAWQYITSELITGTVGDLGKTTRTTIQGQNKFIGSSDELMYSTSKVIFRHQITETQYIELTVAGLAHFNYIYNKEIKTDLKKSLETNDEGKLNDDFNIPLNFSIFMNLTPVDRNKVMYDAMRIVVNAKVVTKLKWYQTGIFKVILVIIAIVWTWYTTDTSGSAFLIELAYSVAVSFAINVAIRIMVDKLGINSKLATAIAIVAMVAYGYESGSVTTADSLVHQVSWISSQAALVIGQSIKIEMEDLQSQMEELKEDMEELEEYKEEHGLNYTPIDFYQIFGKFPPVAPVESAEEFMHRTTRTNPAILSLSIPSIYVDSMLTLPDMHHYNGLKI